MNSPRHFIPSVAVIERRLSSGEDPQKILGDVVDFVAANGPLTPTGVEADPLVCADCVGLLAAHGALVATAQPGCAFETMIQAPMRSRSIFVLDIAHRLAGKPGELPFHILARDFPVKLWDTRVSDPAILAGLHALDGSGRSVSHYLWAADGYPARNHQDVLDSGSNPARMVLKSKAWSSSIRMAWALQAQLHGLGFSMDVPDNQGHTAMDLCIARLEADDVRVVPGLDICNRVQAAMSRSSMATDTPMGGEPLLGPRF